MTINETFNTLVKTSHKWTRYFDVYQTYIDRIGYKPITMLEVGIQNGGSIELWAKVLHPASKIYAIDIDPNCAKLDYSYLNSGGVCKNINIIIGDQADLNFWAAKLPTIGNIDFVIEDGGHTMIQQINTLKAIWKYLNTGGVYIAEDTHTSYWDGWGSEGLHDPNSFVEYCKHLADLVNYNHIKNPTPYLTELYNTYPGLSSVSFYDSMTVVDKKAIVPMRPVMSR